MGKALGCGEARLVFIQGLAVGRWFLYLTCYLQVDSGIGCGLRRSRWLDGSIRPGLCTRTGSRARARSVDAGKRAIDLADPPPLKTHGSRP
jgi:hypothetical protein